MNTSVSPLPLPIWPILGLSLALVSFTAAAVTISAHRATQIYRDSSQLTNETRLETAQELSHNRLAVAAVRSAY